MEVLQERKNELADGMSSWYEFEYQGESGEFSVNEYKSEGNTVYCITWENQRGGELYIAWESNKDSLVEVYPEGFDEEAFREAFKECFDIDIPEA